MTDEQLYIALDEAAYIAEFEWHCGKGNEGFKKEMKNQFIESLKKDGYTNAEEIFNSEKVQNWLKEQYPPIYNK